MVSLFNISILPVFVAFAISYLTVPAIIHFGERLGIIDDPKKNKHPKVIHKYPVPRGGGLSPFLGILVASLFFLPTDSHLVAILIGALLITVVGLLDDKYNLNPYLRILSQIFVAAIPIASGIGIAFITNPFGGIIDLSYPRFSFEIFGELKSIWFLSDLIAVFWIVFMMNMLNMGAKGVDGQLPGVVVIAALAIVTISVRYSADIAQWPVAILASAVLGAYLGFLPWNFYPQKIMPGFSGSTLAGYFLAILSILSTAKIGTLLVALGVPLVDTGYVVIRRMLSGKSPVWGDRGHLHHKLLDMGMSKVAVTLIYWLATFALFLLAVSIGPQSKLYAIISVAIIIGGITIWFAYRSKK